MPLMSTIIVRTGDTNQRVMERTCNMILEVRTPQNRLALA